MAEFREPREGKRASQGQKGASEKSQAGAKGEEEKKVQNSIGQASTATEEAPKARNGLSVRRGGSQGEKPRSLPRPPERESSRSLSCSQKPLERSDSDKLTTMDLPWGTYPGETGREVNRGNRGEGNGNVLMRSPRNWRDSHLLDPLRGIARYGRGGVVRGLHPFRRERLRERLRDLAPIRRIVVLCLGNICRSPYAEGRLTELGRDLSDLRVTSAGFIGPGRPSPDTAQSAARNLGLGLQGHVSRLISMELAAWAELSVVMDPRQAKALEAQFAVPPERIAILGDLDPLVPDRREIPDPLDRSEAFFHQTYQRIDRCMAELLPLIRA